MNIYDCRFVNDSDKVTHIHQYGNSEEEIDLFWREWWPRHYDSDPSPGKYIDCTIFEEDIDSYDDNEAYMKRLSESMKMEDALFVEKSKFVKKANGGKK